MIGIFDSGVGGLSVLRSILALFPQSDFIYLGDTARFPYGPKSPRTIIEYSRNNIDFLIQKGAKVILIACNTASALASDALRQEYGKRLSLLLDVISPVVNQITKISSPGARIGVIGTRATINSQIYSQKINQKRPDLQVISQACPLLVSLVEEGWIEEPETLSIIKKYLTPLKKSQLDYLILSCTHYPLIQDKIEKVVNGKTKVIDPGKVLAESLKEKQHLLGAGGREEFYVTDSPERFAQLSKIFLGKEVDVKLVKI